MDYKGQPILKDLVHNVLTDLAKVVVDWQKKKSSDTGKFRLIHQAKHEIPCPKPDYKLDLTVHGKKYGD